MKTIKVKEDTGEILDIVEGDFELNNTRLAWNVDAYNSENATGSETNISEVPDAVLIPDIWDLWKDFNQQLQALESSPTTGCLRALKRYILAKEKSAQ